MTQRISFVVHSPTDSIGARRQRTRKTAESGDTDDAPQEAERYTDLEEGAPHHVQVPVVGVAIYVRRPGISAPQLRHTKEAQTYGTRSINLCASRDMLDTATEAKSGSARGGGNKERVEKSGRRGTG